MLRTLVVIPTYNNLKTLKGVVEGVLRRQKDLLVVDDGSTDGSLETIKNLPVNILSFSSNKGKGAAIEAGAEWAEKNNYSHIITMDADAQHSPGDIDKFVSSIKKNPLSIVIGKRDFSRDGIPSKSKFGRSFSNFWVRVSSGVSVSDSQSGFRAYPVAAIRKLKCFSRHYNYEVEILVRGIWGGLSVESVDINVHYSKGTKSSSHFHPFRDNFRISTTYTFLVIRHFIPIPHKRFCGSSTGEKLRSFFVNPIKNLKNLFKVLFTERLSIKQITIACMLGIFLGTLPILAAHSITILFFATRLRLNRMIALNISHLCAPPFVPALCAYVGYFIKNGEFLREFSIEIFKDNWVSYVGYYFTGSIVMAPILALFTGFVVFLLLLFYRKVFRKDGR